MTTKTKEEMLNGINHLYWFYNADMCQIENQKDFKATLARLEYLVKEENENE